MGLIHRMVKKFLPDNMWSRLPIIFGLLYLSAERKQLFKNNLFDTNQGMPEKVPEEGYLTGRTADGTGNDLKSPCMGSVGMNFGRNFPIDKLVPLDQRRLLEPDPRLISEQLLARKEFVPAKIINLLGAAWIQFMTHDWFHFHPVNQKEHWTIPLDDQDTFPEKPMTITKTLFNKETQLDPRYIRYENQNSHWWDGSQIYGTSKERLSELRSFVDGQMKIEENGLLPPNLEKGTDSTGTQDNYWVGLSILHTLFNKEHNAICRHLKKKYPSYNDERLFQLARLINTALMAKIHTIEWTPAILPNPIMDSGMHANWYGLLGKKFKKKHIFSSYVLSGFPGNKKNLFGVPFSLTEEFVSVYRLHSLLPDKLDIHSFETGKLIDSLSMHDVVLKNTRKVVEKYERQDLLYSAGIQYPGALCLHNYPNFLRQLVNADGKLIDLATIDVLRDRERQVPRYNEFRRLLDLKPVKSFEDLTQDTVHAEELRKIYKDIEDVDLLVGCLAEKFPYEYGFGETAFEIFILMASRRLCSDRFLSCDFRPEIYTPEGIEWVEENTMADVCLRHYPNLAPALKGLKTAFLPWNKVNSDKSQVT